VPRIIAGRLRGRTVHFPTHTELRPTPARVRETLFNWLMHDIRGAVCLDLFAGSGILGFEAYSRGAKHVVMVESSAQGAHALQANCDRFAAEGISICHLRFPDQAQRLLALGPFDIVFLDPPFASNLLSESVRWLEENELLASPARVYLETNHPFSKLVLPDDWTIFKEKKAGKVYYGLVDVKKRTT